MPNVLIHIQNEDPVLCEVEKLPEPTDVSVMVRHPRRRDGKDLHYLEANVTSVIFPMHRINYIEVMPSMDEDDIISFVRQ